MSKSLRFALLGAGILMLASCKNMEMSKDYFTVTPDPLVAKAGQVE